MVNRARWCEFLLALGLLAILVLACGSEKATDSIPVVTTSVVGHEIIPPPPVHSPMPGDKWALWVGGTQLRGANIYQRRTYPELDGPEFMGDGPVGPPYTQGDFDLMAAMGAN